MKVPFWVSEFEGIVLGCWGVPSSITCHTGSGVVFRFFRIQSSKVPFIKVRIYRVWSIRYVGSGGVYGIQDFGV